MIWGYPILRRTYHLLMHLLPPCIHMLTMNFDNEFNIIPWPSSSLSSRCYECRLKRSTLPSELPRSQIDAITMTSASGPCFDNSSTVVCSRSLASFSTVETPARVNGTSPFSIYHGKFWPLLVSKSFDASQLLHPLSQRLWWALAWCDVL